MPTPLKDSGPPGGGQIEPPATQLDPIVECPRCGKEAPFHGTGAGRQRSRLSKRVVWLAVTTIAVSVVVLVCFYRRFLLSGLDLVAEATGSRMTATLALALGLLALVWVLAWMLFPIFVYFGIRDLRRRTAQLDRTIMLCAHYLSQVTAERHAAKTREVPEEQKPDAESPLS